MKELHNIDVVWFITEVLLHYDKDCTLQVEGIINSDQSYPRLCRKQTVFGTFCEKSVLFQLRKTFNNLKHPSHVNDLGNCPSVTKATI